MEPQSPYWFRRFERTDRPIIRYRELWGSDKRLELVASKDGDGKTGYVEIQPKLELGLVFTPAHITRDYASWPALSQIFASWHPGVLTGRDEFLIDIDKSMLEKRVEVYFDNSVTDAALKIRFPSIMQRTNRYDPTGTRAILLSRGTGPAEILRYCYRPMDMRWIYWDPDTKLLDEKRAKLRACLTNEKSYPRSKTKIVKVEV